MASEKKSFSELLGEAPLATAEKTISLTGVLARSNDPKKFVLTMGDNQTVTLDIAAVKEHKVLSGMVGQMVVQIEVDRDKVPSPVTEGGQVGHPIKFPAVDQTIAYRDLHFTMPWDPWTTDALTDHKIPYVDQHPPYKNINEVTGTIMENVVYPGNYGVDPGYYAGQAIAPFALATPHQAPQEMLAGAVPPYQGPQFGGPMGPIRTSPIWDLRTITYLDKNPILDITGHFPHPD
jgi:hypothetical protein